MWTPKRNQTILLARGLQKRQNLENFAFSTTLRSFEEFFEESADVVIKRFDELFTYKIVIFQSNSAYFLETLKLSNITNYGDFYKKLTNWSNNCRNFLFDKMCVILRLISNVKLHLTFKKPTR